jgi:hypothetical protein
MSLYDFYMYLKYIEFSAENLEFYIWSVVWPLQCECLLTMHRFKNYETAYFKMGSVKDDSSLHSAPESTSSEARLDEKVSHIDDSEFSVDFSVDPEVGESPFLHERHTASNTAQPRTQSTASHR